MPDEVTLEVTTIEENVTVETTAGDVVEIQVLAPTGAAATITVGTTTTLAPGSSATVANAGTSSAAVFNFGIPTGATGATGPAGPNSVTSATTSNGTANLTLNNVSTVSFTAGNSSTTSGEITIFTNGPVFQWRSDTVEYGERGFTFLTTDITSEVNYTLPNATGTIALTTSNVATATALQNSRNIFGIAFNGTANVAGDATNTGHFASIPTGGQAGHFVTLNGTAPTVVAGRSAWWSDGSGNPSFRNGTGTAVTLVKSSDLGTNVATFLATPISANLASAVTDETGSGSLVFATSPTLTTPMINSATIGTAATFNATSYTYGTGAAAAMNQSLGTSSVDSRISSLFAVPFQFAQDGFFGRWLTASGNNSFNWILVGTATNWSEAAFNASGFLGGVNLMVNNAAFFYYIAPCAAASIANFNGVVYDQVFNINTSIAAENIFIGIRNAASSTAEVGRRGLYYEAGVDTNWQLLHETSAGVKTKVDTGKSVTLNQIVRVTIKFVSATQTDMIIATSTSTTPVTVSATSGFSCTGSLGLGFWLQSTTANNKYISPMRSTLAWPTSTL